MTPWASAAVVRGIAAFAAVAALWPACTCRGEKRELGLSRVRDAAPVIVVDQPVEGGVVGPLAKEVEPNDERGKAAVVAAPGGVEGTLAAAMDMDFYRIDAAPGGRTMMMRLIGPGEKEGGADLVLHLYDGDGKVLLHSDRGPAGVLEALPNAALTGGATYFVSVSAFVKKDKKKPKKGDKTPAAAAGATASLQTYQLTVEPVTPATESEVEPNDLADGAREVLLADEVNGYLGWTKDVDHWKLSLDGFTGGFALDVEATAVDGVPLVLDVVAPDGHVVASRRSEKGRGVHVRGLLPESGARYWLARLSGGRSNPEEGYRLRPTSRAIGEGEEAEPNDVEDRALLIGPVGDGTEGQRRGFLDGGDVDFYRIEGASEPMALALTLEPPSSVDVQLRVLRPGGAELTRADGGKAGQREEADALLGGGAVLFVVVSGTALGDEADPYVLTWRTRADLTAPPTPPPGAQQPAPTDEPAPSEDPYDQ
jgi:hypothetical protein